jgi:AraC-like DNA-binding protein
MAYRNALRAKIARELLLNTAISVKGIAEKLGFTDASDFARSFAKVYGISPTEMRKRERTER